MMLNDYANDPGVLANCFWDEADRLGSGRMSAMKENCRFYAGNQWDSVDLAALAEAGKPALTFNHIRSSVDLVSGYQRRFRQQANVLPQNSTSTGAASLATRLLHHTMDACNGDYVLSDMFLWGLRANEGFIELLIDHDYRDPRQGQLKIKNLSPLRVVVDPRCTSYDLNDINAGARFIFNLKWVDESDLELLYPNSQYIKDSLSELRGDDYRTVTPEDNDDDLDLTEDYEHEYHRQRFRQYRIKECWWRSIEREHYLCDDRGMFTKKLRPDQVAAARRIAQLQENMQVVSVLSPKLHLTTMLGNNVIEHADDPFEGINMFPIVRFAPYFVDGHCFGMVADLKDPQREVNKRMSQALHNLNQGGASGLWAPIGCLVDIDNWRNNMSSPGFIGQYNPKFGIPTRQDPMGLSTGHVTLAEMSNRHLEEISGINAELKGFSNGQQSGKAIEIKRDQGLMVGEPLFDNFNHSQMILYQTMLRFITHEKSPYSDQEVLWVVGNADNLELNIEDLRDWRTGAYRVKVSTAAHHPTERKRQYYELLELVEKFQLPIPPDMILKYSDFEHKDELINYFRAMREAQAAAQQSMGEMDGLAPVAA